MAGIKYENPVPAKIPVMIDAAPNIPAMDAYSGSTVLQFRKVIFSNQSISFLVPGPSHTNETSLL